MITHYESQSEEEAVAEDEEVLIYAEISGRNTVMALTIRKAGSKRTT